MNGEGRIGLMLQGEEMEMEEWRIYVADQHRAGDREYGILKHVTNQLSVLP